MQHANCATNVFDHATSDAACSNGSDLSVIVTLADSTQAIERLRQQKPIIQVRAIIPQQTFPMGHDRTHLSAKMFFFVIIDVQKVEVLRICQSGFCSGLTEFHWAAGTFHVGEHLRNVDMNWCQSWQEVFSLGLHHSITCHFAHRTKVISS